MLKFFRDFFKSKFGVPFTLAFLVLIGIAFASSDVANNSTFGGIAGGDRVATVGDSKIDTSDLRAAISSAYDQARQSDPTLTMETFLASGGMDRVVDNVVRRASIAEFGREYGFRVSNRLVDSELLQIGAFRGADGNFDQQTYEGALRSANLTDSIFRNDLTQGLFVRQILLPAAYGATMPRSMASRYATLLKERRSGAIASLSSEAFAPAGDPSDKVLGAYYQENRNNYVRPERRTIRYVTFGEDAVRDLPAPTDAQIAARYERDKAQYAATENRTFTQLVVPTQALANEIAQQARSGTSLAAIAQARGLATTQFGPVTRQEAAGQSSAAVATAAFSADRGAIAAPARGPLGFYVLRVDNIDRRAGRTLAQVRGDIAQQLATEQRRAAFLNLAGEVEDEIDGGASLAELSQTLDLDIVTLEPATANGRIYGKDTTVPEFFGRVLPVVFEVDEGDPQLAEAEPGKTIMVFEVSEITPSAIAPLSEIRRNVIADWKRSEGSRLAREAADRVVKRVEDGQTLAQAVAAETASIPVQNTSLDRQALSQMQDVPGRVALFFSMAEGSVKKLEAQNSGGWYVITVTDIAVPDLTDGDAQMVDQVTVELSQAVEGEYTDQLVAAIEKDIGAERNQAAIDAVGTSLTGNSQQ
ncbi:peptidylprolyl isomerase [Paraurantiacibacter namhicola]|uniref:Parvulin-like PPIase n=1 Tax=Paraurantiacibacter namhicola TaxID=645517 RepID=A0A1C7D9S9_9SPHN|nr:peptidylprolyl isomerase [Paraurantiacibacter namhicola]ANU08063.1 Peptidyl-prolyl cis-trans isomerase D [Paraurantiacibacter namhicola]